MDVIARKKNGLIPLFVIFLTLGALIVGGGVVCFVMGNYSILPAIILTVLGAAIIALGAFCWLKWKKLPQEIVCVGEGKIQLPEGMYALNDVLNVSYRCPLGALKVRWGRLYIEFENKVFAYGFVEDVAETQKALLALRLSNCNAPIDR